MTKYAHIINNTIDTISFQPKKGWQKVPAHVFAGWQLVKGEWQPPAAPPVGPDQINTERDRRIAENFTFGGNAYQFDEASKQRITGFATLAGFAIEGGAQANDLRWLDADTDAGFITADNMLVTMDAQTAFAFGQAAAAHERAHIFAARTLKNSDPIPADYQDDRYWP